MIRRLLLEKSAWARELAFLNEFDQFVQDLKNAPDRAQLKEWDSVRDRIRSANAALLEPSQSEEDDWVRLTYETVAAGLQDSLRHLKRTGSKMTYALYNVVEALNKLREIRVSAIAQSQVNLIAVMADAGFGKTCLSLAIAKAVQAAGAAVQERPAGILFLARDLSAGAAVDSLVPSLSIAGCRLDRMDDVLFVLNQAGRRHHCRLPLVIDGLNESERPSDWKAILARLEASVRRNYPNVLLVVTLRTGESSTGRWMPSSARRKSVERMRYHDLCLPEATKCCEISGMDILPMSQHYFKVYKLNVVEALPPVLRHPLALRLYCEYENHERREWKTPDDLPSDLSHVFARYLDHVAENIAPRLADEDLATGREVRNRLKGIGAYLWEGCCRTGDCKELNTRLGGVDGPWLKSWTRLLMEEGLIQLREDAVRPDVRRFDVAYDALGGYLIAEYLYERHENSLAAFVRGTDFEDRVGRSRHPLAEDILMSLTSIYAMRRGAYLGSHAPTWLKDRLPSYALRLSARGAMDAAQKAVAMAFRVDVAFRKKVFERVLESSCWSEAAWGGTFLDRLLNAMSLVERDVNWGYWILQNASNVLMWLDGGRIGDSLNVLYVLKWLLTSNVREVRDRATRRLVEIGRTAPEKMFEFIKSNLHENDPYVGERLLAVGYGVAMFVKACVHVRTERAPASLVEYALFLAEGLKSGKLIVLQHHYLALDYLLNTIKLVRTLMPKGQAGALSAFDVPYKITPTPDDELGPKGEEIPATVAFALGIDLKAYALTRLVGADHYHMEGSAYKALESRMCKRIAAMRYRWEIFKEVDAGLYEHRWSQPVKCDDVHVVRWGHKYSLIAYLNELAERTSGGLPEAMREYADVDPSFPSAVSPFPGSIRSVIEDEPQEIGRWLKQKQAPDLSFLTDCKLDGEDVEWTLLWGYYDEKDAALRELFASVRTVLVDQAGLEYFRQHPGNVPREGMAEKYYVFYGEIPWGRNAFCMENPHAENDEYRDEEFNVRMGPEKRQVSMRIEVPLADYTWGSFYSPEHEDCGAVLPSPRMMQDMGLILSGCEWEAVDRKGRRATRYFHGKDGELEYSFLYIRKDILIDYARERGMTLMRVFAGERNVKSGESVDATIGGYAEFAEVQELFVPSVSV